MKTQLRVPAYRNLLDRGLTAAEDCILSNATKTKSGYRHLWWAGRAHKAHRVAYQEWHGDIPEGFHIDHKCHNEAAHAGLCDGGDSCIHRSCVNPMHLRVISAHDNIYASPHSAPGRGQRGYAAIAAAKTHCKQGHEFSEENTYIFHNKKTDRTTRQCRICSKATIERNRQAKIDAGLTVHGTPRKVPFVNKPKKGKVT